MSTHLVASSNDQSKVTVNISSRWCAAWLMSAWLYAS
eukprot:COSAG01_NODE_4169_length_5274_cov_8.543575_5_plen_37_part_00